MPRRIDVAEHPVTRNGHAQSVGDLEVCAKPRAALVLRQLERSSKQIGRRTVSRARSDCRSRMAEVVRSGCCRHARPQARHARIQAI